MTGVEFLAEAGADGPPPEPATHRRRPWWLLGLLALVVAAGVWVIARPSDHAARSAAQSAVPAPRYLTGPIGTAAPSDRAAIACHGAPFCAASVDIPAELHQVLRRYLPHVRALQVRSYVGRVVTGGGRYLTDRDIAANARSYRVVISLHRNYQTASAPSAIVATPAGGSSAGIHVVTTAYTIDLQYVSPRNPRVSALPSLAALRRLCRDTRLESL